MTEVAIGTVRHLLAAPDDAPHAAVLATARGAGHKLAGTLLSLRAAGGERLTGAEAAELAAARERVERYATVWSGLTARIPGLLVVKGMAIGAFYPPGVLRSAGDLDVVCSDHEAFWAAALQLAGTGWEMVAFTLLPARRDDHVSPHLFAEFRTDAGDGAEPYVVGLVTAEVFTDLRRPACRLPRPVHSPLAVTTLALVAERWEREFRSRDLLDLTLLLRELDAAGVAELRAGLALAGLWPEWCEAMDRVGRLGWRPAVVLPDARRAAARERVLRAGRAVRRWCSPVRLLAGLARAGAEDDVSGWRTAFYDAASDLLHLRVGTRRLLAAGVPLFAVPLDERPDTTPGLDLVTVGRHLVARTPLGVFLIAAGAVRQEWLDEVGGDPVEA
ncbi:hypothetical protein [Streptantibioticus silvisoli]|uniref:Nucleotidyltransferase family protein n=1 Tax=Streptantibioticus silvisoli TaxID=2705255 RepID=A0ABT6VV18_9ACTN|nr:hypothetical protein [Streptantibioticus silvisoli]MDI5962324.1 hypothetical protein [Streptantibioticus silvisoli]